MTRALLSMAATLLQTHHNHQTCYGRAKKAANATGANFVKNSLAEAAESGYMHDIGSRTLEVLDAIRAHLATPDTAPAWHDAPTVPGLWVCVDKLHGALTYTVTPDNLTKLHNAGDSWFGPIPADDGGKP